VKTFVSFNGNQCTFNEYTDRRSYGTISLNISLTCAGLVI